ncbi:MAG: hypothetical protein IKA95_00985 [Clostridia bacterium]|nr:hypothetical protein [Clostridia bacterium]
MKEEINIVKIFEIILKLWWVILIFAIIGSLVAFSISSFLMTPLYTSTAKVYVSGSEKADNAGVNINDINVSQRLVGTYIEILSGNSFLEDIANAYNAQTSKKSDEVSLNYIKANLKMDSANGTEILQIKYSDTTPQKAQAVLEILLGNAQQEITRVIDGCRMSVIDYADLPVTTSSPNVKQNTFIGMFLGIVLGAAVVFLKELFDTRNKDEDDIKARYGVAVLGSIPNLDVD